MSDLFYRLAYALRNHLRIRQIITPIPAKIMILASAIIAPRAKHSELISDVSPKIPRSGIMQSSHVGDEYHCTEAVRSDPWNSAHPTTRLRTTRRRFGYQVLSRTVGYLLNEIVKLTKCYFSVTPTKCVPPLGARTRTQGWDTYFPV